MRWGSVLHGANGGWIPKSRGTQFDGCIWRWGLMLQRWAMLLRSRARVMVVGEEDWNIVIRMLRWGVWWACAGCNVEDRFVRRAAMMRRWRWRRKWIQTLFLRSWWTGRACMWRCAAYGVAVAVGLEVLYWNVIHSGECILRSILIQYWDGDGS